MSEKNKTVEATLSINVHVECPHCNKYIDLLDSSDTLFDHNEEGLVINQACPNGSWYDKHENFDVDDVTCGDCGKEFDVKRLNW